MLYCIRAVRQFFGVLARLPQTIVASALVSGRPVVLTPVPTMLIPSSMALVQSIQRVYNAPTRVAVPNQPPGSFSTVPLLPCPAVMSISELDVGPIF